LPVSRRTCSGDSVRADTPDAGKCSLGRAPFTR
jgi:hypothetical protein